MLVGGGLAELSPTPKSIIDEGPQRTVYRYRPARGGPHRRSPVLLVPPLAAPASSFDLRRGCSLAEHLVARGHPTYLVDYGPISFSDRALGLEHWVDEVIPEAVEAVSEDAGGAPVQPVGWCLGGIMTLLAVAGDQKLPVSSVAMVASPFDFAQVRMFAPIRRLSQLTGGALVSALYRGLGGAPAPLVSLGFRLTAFDRYLTKPLFLAQNLGDRDTLAHAEAVDNYMARMLAYPGRTFGQLYHAFFRVNELAGGKVLLSDQEIDLAAVRQPVLSVAGGSDVLAPRGAVRHVADLLPNAQEVRLRDAPGGHLGVLTGRSARRTTWPEIDEFLAGNDRVELQPRRARRSTGAKRPPVAAQPA
ncbi:MAG TPA: alpha/beta fold hydrolase [Thermoleophilaceae bacterium]|nr:alpha/beta fold hydrolase [Thermoleophilaceae bacterium]